ncbi:hypothetical protein JOF56_009724 [Kibdelosporangium banguiense]|uniref:Uncharacterized protein n=1 Tax=Kibdelosporangium banguiense TaxID=1365924 RepID=A0ABS4TY73_9PSEU|nr:hypothetical protein [Kibdelosporangium banguiense]MBP2329339.1 hypothetical protein [Kibdelosporangium banguiense]
MTDATSGTVTGDGASHGHPRVLMTPERLRKEMAEIARWAPRSTITIADPADPDRVFVVTGFRTNLETGEVELIVRER